ESRLLSEFIARACDEPLPGAVAEKTRHHILDTIAAMLSGSRLRAGNLAAAYVGRFAQPREATVIGTSLMAPAEFAALANGMATRPTTRTLPDAFIRAAASCRRRSQWPRRWIGAGPTSCAQSRSATTSALGSIWHWAIPTRTTNRATAPTASAPHSVPLLQLQ